jgi:hypothetical protein
MKLLYTILFFLDTLALVLFSYYFLKMLDRGFDELSVLSLLFGIVACIILLVFIMLQFVKPPGSGRRL